MFRHTPLLHFCMTVNVTGRHTSAALFLYISGTLFGDSICHSFPNRCISANVSAKREFKLIFKESIRVNSQD